MPDEVIQSLVDGPDTQEALAWLKGGSETDFRSLGELGPGEHSIALVQRFYDAGAVEVLAVEIDIDDEDQNTGQLVVKLPVSADSRLAVLVIVNDLNQLQGFDPASDDGQSYVFVVLD